MFNILYDRLLKYSKHPQALWILSVVAFLESSISPVPPDVLLIPMMLANRSRAFYLAFVCAAVSVVGGFVGYWIGYSLYDTIGQYLVEPAALSTYQSYFSKWGFLLISIKGFLPIPYKIVAIASGLAHYDFSLFLIASIIARFSRFLMLAILIYFFGDPIKNFIERYLPYVLIGGVVLTLGTIYIATLF
jgi:membrane protein YqaA with SNARE-associated domain